MAEIKYVGPPNTKYNFNWYYIKVEDIFSHFEQFFVKYHDSYMSKKSSNIFRNVQILLIFSYDHSYEFQFSVLLTFIFPLKSIYIRVKRKHVIYEVLFS